MERELLTVYKAWPEARRVDAIYGIAEVSAVSILARIGDVRRFKDADALVDYAGLAPGVRSSDGKSKDLHIGGGGTDKSLRHYLIEATKWACRIPRYRATHQRMIKRRGKKVARIVVARLLLRSVYKMLTDGVRFNPTPRRRLAI